jgi:DNA-binding protein Fis
VHGYLNLALHYSEFSWKLPQIKLILNALLAIMIINIIFNRQIIAGVEFTSITITRTSGPLYGLFQAYTAGGVLAGILILAKGFQTLTSNLSRQRCFVILLSSLPPALVALAVLVIMASGLEITAALIMPIAVSLMVGAIVYAEEKTRLFQLLTLVPYSAERKLHKQLMNKITNCLLINDDPSAQPQLNLKHMMKDFEVSVVEHVIRYYHGNQKLAAMALGVSEATISRRARAMNLKGSDSKPAKQPQNQRDQRGQSNLVL